MPRGRPPRLHYDGLAGEERVRALTAVDARLVRVRERISVAALGCLRNSLDAALLVRAALDEVERARALLAQVGTGEGEA